MNLQEFEWKVGLLAAAQVFDAETKEALGHVRDIVAALRASRGLPYNFNAKDLLAEVWAGQVTDEVEPVEPSGGMKAMAGYLKHQGVTQSFQFEVAGDATVVEKDAACLAALREVVEVDFLEIGEEAKEDAKNG